MKNQIITCLIFLSTSPFLSFGQQIPSQETRPLSAWQQFEIQRGEVENFKSLTYRFEVAWEDSDIQSMSDIRDGLIKLMEAETNQLAAADAPSDKNEVHLTKEKDTLEKVKKMPISLNDAAFGKKAEQVKSLFRDFILEMEADITEQAEALRAASKE